MAKQPKPALLRFEGPMYPDGSGPEITVEYSQGGKFVEEPHVIIDPDDSAGGTYVYLRNVPWLVETLRRVLQETA